jgi:hypothetical protein
MQALAGQMHAFITHSELILPRSPASCPILERDANLFSRCCKSGVHFRRTITDGKPSHLHYQLIQVVLGIDLAHGQANRPLDTSGILCRPPLDPSAGSAKGRESDPTKSNISPYFLDGGCYEGYLGNLGRQEGK